MTDDTDDSTLQKARCDAAASIAVYQLALARKIVGADPPGIDNPESPLVLAVLAAIASNYTVTANK